VSSNRIRIPVQEQTMNTAANAGFRAIALAAVAVALGACAALQGGASPTEGDFGNSVRHVVEGQKAHPEVSANPSPEAVELGDGARLQSVLETYRSDTGRPAEVKRDLIIDLSR
jgi:hypothetical protein